MVVFDKTLNAPVDKIAEECGELPGSYRCNRGFIHESMDTKSLVRAEVKPSQSPSNSQQNREATQHFTRIFTYWLVATLILLTSV